MAPRPASASAIFACALAFLTAPVRAEVNCSQAAGGDREQDAIVVCKAAQDADARAQTSLKSLQAAVDQLAHADKNSQAAALQQYEAAKKDFNTSTSYMVFARSNMGRFPSLDKAEKNWDIKGMMDQANTIETTVSALTAPYEQSAEGKVPATNDDGSPQLNGGKIDAHPASDDPDDGTVGDYSYTAQVPKNASPAVKAAAQSVNSGNPAAAEKSMDQALASNPNDPAALAVRAQARMAQGNNDGALADANEALKLNPNDKASRALVNSLQNLNRASGKIKAAKLDFGGDRAPDGGPGGGQAGARPAGASEAAPRIPASGAGLPTAAPVVAATPAVRSLIQRAQQLSGIGDYTGAMLPLREALDLDPKRPELWDLLAEDSDKTGNFKGALAAAENALKLDPGDARALRAQSYAAFELGDYRAALADAERAVSLDPGNGLGFLYRAMAEEKLGQTEKALADYRKAEQLDPTVAGLAEAGVKRLGGDSGAAAPSGAANRSSRMLLRGGAIAASTLLIVLGLMGTAAGRRLTTRGARAPAPVADDEDEAKTVAIGSRLAGNYRVTRELGRGGMGVVYQAYDETLQRHVAIKQLQREGRENTGDLERFLREARLVAQLKHPHLAQIHSVINQGDLLLVFEYVEGQTLDRTLSSEKKFPPEKVRRLVGEICDALTYAHGQKIIHRDLKPSNVMIDAAGKTKIMDFGIAHQSHGNATMTQTNASGTPPYMAPEQGFGSVSKSADLYALAVMTYEMLTGVRPFRGPDFLEPKLRGEFTPATKANPALPPSIDGFFKRALDPDPTKRHADAAEFARALNESLNAAPNLA